MKRELLIFKTKIDQKYHQDVLREINYSNALRGRVMMFLVFLLELGLIIGFDIPNIITNGFSGDNAGLYMLLHLFLFTLGAFSSYISHLYVQNPNQPIFKKMSMEYFFVITAGLFLFGITIINGLDQLYNSSTTMLMFFLVIIALFAMIKPKHNIIMMILIYTTFVTTILIFQSDPALLLSNLINGSLAFIVATLAGIMTYNQFYDYTLKTLKLEEMSITDDLSKLLNRRKLDELLSVELARAKRGTYTFSSMMIDIDDFKILNDTHGHLVGDEVIKNLANIFLENVREEDSIIRYGGEEFFILLTNSTISDAFKKAESIREIIKKTRFNGHIKTTVSIGVASYQTGDTKQSIIARSDHALYEAKRNGKNKVILKQ